jgi:hypothetical protein
LLFSSQLIGPGVHLEANAWWRLRTSRMLSAPLTELIGVVSCASGAKFAAMASAQVSLRSAGLQGRHVGRAGMVALLNGQVWSTLVGEVRRARHQRANMRLTRSECSKPIFNPSPARQYSRFARSEVLDKVWSQRLDDVMEDRRNSSQRCDGVKRDARLRGWEEEGAERRLQRYARHEVWEARGGAHH